MNESQLIRSAQQGNLDAFSTLVNHYQGGVRACLLVRLSNRHEADDLAQEAFIVAYRKILSFDPDRAFGPWVRSIALNLLRNHLRKHRATPIGGAAELEILIDKHTEEEFPSDTDTDALAALKQCMAKLDTPLSRLLHRRYVDEEPVAELARTLGVPHSTITMRLHRLRQQLRICMERSQHA